MIKKLYATRDSTGIDVSVQDECSLRSPIQLTQDDVTKIVGILLGLNLSSGFRATEGAYSFVLTDTDKAWLTAVLSLAVDNRSSRVRRRAIQALAAVDGSKALEVLKRGLEDKDESVRWVAKRSVGRLMCSSKEYCRPLSARGQSPTMSV